MRKLNLRRLFGFVGMAALIGAVSFAPSGASFDCPAATECVGTDFADTLDDHAMTKTLQALGGDDTITLDEDGAGATDHVFGGPGHDRFLILTTGDAEIVFGEDGDDSFKVAMSPTPDPEAQHVLDGGRGNDFFLIQRNSTVPVHVFDGPGADTVLVTNGENSTPVNVRLTADNEQDTVRTGAGDDTIELQKGSGRDVIDCGGNGSDSDTLILNGNRKATDTFGNNLRKAALLGGMAQSNCETIIP